ncbi:hypothetical protein ACM6Q8_27295 [Bacillus wiedmannii]|uniref:hypothetical protein n=1 Tax=Bacillus wiedmannii TaxID=1890302 RepID=UPI0039FC63BF
MDQLTETLSKVLDHLLLRNPKGTILGIFLGVLTHGIILLFLPLLKAKETFKNISIESLVIYHYVIFWVAILNIPYFFKKETFDPEIETAIKGIELYKDQGAADWEVQQAYKDLAYAVINKVHPVESSEKQTAEQNPTMFG